MKITSAETGDADVAVKQAASLTPPPSPPPPPFVKKSTVSVNVTNKEIARFWRQKRINEEDHLLAAIKAAARIRARKLTTEDYKRFEESLKNDDDSKAEDHTNNSSKFDENEKERRVGIKDWWTKSKYAYLNQPAVGSVDVPKRRISSYIPNICNYMPPPPPTSSLGIF